MRLWHSPADRGAARQCLRLLFVYIIYYNIIVCTNTHPHTHIHECAVHLHKRPVNALLNFVSYITLGSYPLHARLFCFQFVVVVPYIMYIHYTICTHCST